MPFSFVNRHQKQKNRYCNFSEIWEKYQNFSGRLSLSKVEGEHRALRHRPFDKPEQALSVGKGITIN
jgi:hypothetical protein